MARTTVSKTVVAAKPHFGVDPTPDINVIKVATWACDLIGEVREGLRAAVFLSARRSAEEQRPPAP